MEQFLWQLQVIRRRFCNVGSIDSVLLRRRRRGQSKNTDDNNGQNVQSLMIPGRES